MDWPRVWRHTLKQEVLGPVTRRTLLVQIGLALALDLLELWAVLVWLTLVFLVGTSLNCVTDPRMWHCVAIACCAIPLVLAVTGFLMFMRSELDRGIVAVLLVIPSVIGTIILSSPAVSD